MSIVLSAPDPLLKRMGANATVVTIGNFDGVHKGHKALLLKTAETARRLGLPAVAITFDPHPESLFSPSALRVLCTNQQKIELLEQAGMDAIILMPFTRSFAAQTASQFCSSVLDGTLHAAEIFVGYDFRLGSDQAFDLSKFGSFHLSRVPAILSGGQPISSTRIRTALAQSLFDEAAAMLGRPFAIRGEVVHGAGRGGPLLGIPTANMRMDEHQVTPPPAAYATSARIADADGFGEWKRAVTSFSRNPTFHGNTLSLETHILDFDDDIYGKTLEVRFLFTLRSERRFQSFEELRAQLHADIDIRRGLPY